MLSGRLLTRCVLKEADRAQFAKKSSLPFKFSQREITVSQNHTYQSDVSANLAQYLRRNGFVLFQRQDQKDGERVWTGSFLPFPYWLAKRIACDVRSHRGVLLVPLCLPRNAERAANVHRETSTTNLSVASAPASGSWSEVAIRFGSVRCSFAAVYWCLSSRSACWMLRIKKSATLKSWPDIRIFGKHPTVIWIHISLAELTFDRNTYLKFRLNTCE